MLFQVRSMPKAGSLDAAIIKASASYTRRGARIVDEKVISRIRIACERLGIRFNGDGEEKSVGSEPEEVYYFPKLEDLIRAREVGKRNGKYHRLRRMKDGMVQLGLLESSIAYLRKGHKIVSTTIKKALEAVIERLEPASRMISKSRILKRGGEKAAELLDRFRSLGVLNWAPQLSAWLKSESYRFWLGITQIYAP